MQFNALSGLNVTISTNVNDATILIYSHKSSNYGANIVGKYLLNVNVEAEHGIGGSLRELLTILHNQDRIRCILEGVILILVGV